MKYNKDNPPRSVCVMRLSAIGDICHTIPVIKTLQHYWPYTSITWIIGKTEYELVEGLPDINFVIFDKSKGFGAILDMNRQLRGKHFDLLLHLQEALRSSIATVFVRARYKLGYHRKDCQDFQWLFTNRKIPLTPRIHYMERLLLFTDSLGLTPPQIRWDIPVNASDTARAKSFIPKDKPFVVISPCSSIVKNNYRNWTQENYIEIVRSLIKDFECHVILTGGPGVFEKQFARQIELNSRVPVSNLVGQLNLKQLLVLLKHAKAVISPDSGPAHMANTVGTPVIGLFYSSNPDFTGPYYNRDWIVNRYPEALEKYNHTNVVEAPWGMRVRTPDAAELITVEDVKEKLQKLSNTKLMSANEKVEETVFSV